MEPECAIGFFLVAGKAEKVAAVVHELVDIHTGKK